MSAGGGSGAMCWCSRIIRMCIPKTCVPDGLPRRCRPPILISSTPRHKSPEKQEPVRAPSAPYGNGQFVNRSVATRGLSVGIETCPDHQPDYRVVARNPLGHAVGAKVLVVDAARRVAYDG